MKYTGKTNEIFFIAPIVPERKYMFEHDLKTGLSIVWNVGKEASFKIDNRTILLKKDCIIFLTEYHRLEDFKFEKLNVIQFNRPFHCVEKHDDDISCKGLLFFGAADIPKIEIPEEKLKHFKLLWEVFLMEIDESDGYKLEMLRSLLKRFLILCVRIYRNENFDISQDDKGISLIREYNYLVEQHFKTYTKVSDYAKLLFKSPKTLSNVFKKYIDKSPLQIINERRLLEAIRLLTYTSFSIQEIADELNFNDVQSFSHFFKKRKEVPPSVFKEKLKKE